MRHFNLLLVSLLLVVSGVFTSCKDDTENDATISFLSKSGYVSADAEVVKGGTFKIAWSATCTSSDMKYVSITKDDADITGWNLKEIDSDYKSAYTDSATLTASSNTGSYTYTITVYDKDEAKLASVSVVITVTEDYTTYTSKLLYDALSAGTSKTFFSSSTGSTYTVSEAVSAASSVDFGFLYDQAYSTTKACLISFDSYSSTGNYTSSLTGSYNATYFKISSESVYTAATTASALASAYTSGTTPTSISGYTQGKIVGTISAGDYIAFKTASSKYGIIYVSAISRDSESSSNSQTMTITVKVQN
jgi:hypothetical protein